MHTTEFLVEAGGYDDPANYNAHRGYDVVKSCVFLTRQ